MINPPIGTTVQDIWDAIKAGSLTHVRMKFDDDLMVEDQDIDINTGLVVADMLNGDTDLTFGRAVSKQLTTTIMMTNRTAYLPWTKEFELLMGVEINGSTVWMSIGYFSGTRPKNYTVKDKVEFTAYDRMTNFDRLADDFWSGLDFTTPLSLEDIYHALCTYVGVGYDSGDELSASFQRTYDAAPMDLTGYTCRDVLAWIAEAVGCYAKINASGNCQLVWFGDATSHVITRNEEFHIEHADLYSGMIWDEFDLYTWDEADVFTWDEVEGYYSATYGIRGVKIKQTNLGMDVDYPSTQPWNVYTIMDNPFLQIENLVTDPITYVKPIYDRLVALGGQLPMNADCIGCWCIEAGDIITIHVANEEIHLPVFCKTMKWNGATHDEYETTGEKFRKIINDSQKQRVINNRNIKLYVDGNYYGIVSGIEIEPEGITVDGSKYVKIRSGNTLQVESGGNIDINGSGNLKLTGSTVEIKSGSTFTVDSTNFKVDSTNKEVTTGEWTLQQKGLVSRFTSPYGYGDNAICYGRWENIYETSNIPTMCIASSLDTNSSTNKYGCSWYNIMRQKNSDMCYMLTWLHPDSSTPNSGIQVTNEVGNSYTDIRGLLGTDYDILPYKNKWEICASAIRYDTISQRSSRDIKHDIRDMESQGEKLDNLRPVTFIYDDDAEERTRYGLIYEEVMETIPDICIQGEGIKAVSYMELVPMLLKEIQDLRKRVAQLEEREV